jgi:hypothetical protein
MTPGELLFVLSLLAAFLAVATAVSGRSRILRAWNLTTQAVGIILSTS